MEVIFFRDGASVPVKDWLDREVAKLDIRIAAKCRVRINMLKEQGFTLRRPYAEYLRNGIYELRIAFGRVNYRILYFFHRDGKAVILAHGLIKEDIVPDKEIDIAVMRKEAFESDPERYTYHEEA